MVANHSLAALDYIVLVAMLLISLAIGIRFKYISIKQGQKTSQYLLAGKNMSMFPVVLSITVTGFSAISLVVLPAEVYRFNIQLIWTGLGILVGIFLANCILVPVYFQCGVSTIYEFLELRFGKTLRYIVSALFILQMVLYMCSCILPPVLALNAVTNISIELSIITCGTVCTLYCMLGGLKGVLWTDVFQFFLIFSYIAIVYVAGIADAGGISTIFRRAWEGNKLHLDFGMNLVKRYTVWASFSSGLLFGLGSYGASQTEIQRLLSLSTLKRAKISLFVSMFTVSSLHVLCISFGLVLYSIYHDCDPVLNQHVTGIKKYDQMVPYYIVSKFSSMPGMTGLCMAGIFSGSLSTVSSVLNSLATVTLVDFIKPLFPSSRFDDTKQLIVAKCLSLLYGLLCLSLPFAMINVASLKQLASSLYAIVEGPMTVVFLVGVLSRKVKEKSAIVGLLAGVTVASWLMYSTLFGGYIEAAVNMGCCGNSSTIVKDTCNNSTSTPDYSFSVHKISFLWIRLFGATAALAVMYMCALITGWNENAIPETSLCLSPVTRLWNSLENTKPIQETTDQSTHL